MYNSSSDLSAHLLPAELWTVPLTLKSLCGFFAGCADFQKRKIDVGLEDGASVWVCWIDGLISSAEIAESILRPLTQPGRFPVRSQEELFPLLRRGGISCASVTEVTAFSLLSEKLNRGFCAVVFGDLQKALCFEVKSGNTRAVSEPTLEKSLKGSKDSFVETLRTNTALVRRRLATPLLKVLESDLGRKSHTCVALLYLDGVADNALVDELARRLDRIDVDAVSSLGQLEELLADCPRSPFPQLLHTERPDRLARHLLDGRMGLLVDGFPIALVLPVTFAEFMKVSGDGNMNFLFSTVLTVLRYLSLVLALLLPAVYVAITKFHPEMIPSALLQSMIEAKRDVPFSTAAEVIGLLLAFALLQEAGLRLPNPIGDTVSIIGALIVGQSAVDARLVSPIAIIVVALSGICCYTLPSQDLSMAIRLFRLLLLLLAAATGLYGICLGCCLMFLLLSEMSSLGLNYTDPLSGGQGGGFLRLLWRSPQRDIKTRDAALSPNDRRRQR